MSRNEVIKACGLSTGGTTKLFDELKHSGFIKQYTPFERNSPNRLYKLSDEYSLFYLKFIEHARSTGAGTWHKITESQS